MIILSITGPDMRRAKSQLRSSSRYADIIEFRVDLIRNASLPVLLSATRKPVIITCRPRWEGGAFVGEEKDRITMLLRALKLGADYVDIELRSKKSSLEQLIDFRREAVVVSAHYHERRVGDVDRLYNRMHATGAAVVKFAFTARDAHDIRHVSRFLARAREDNRKAVAIAMGEPGEASRILYRVYGGWATYAAPEKGAPAAPGQVTIRRLRMLFRAHTLTPGTKVCAVIGNPVRQSKGIVVHNTLFSRDRINGVYVRFPVVNLHAFMMHVASSMHGFSVTVPHKERIMKFLDSIDPTARKIGAVNTVLRKDGRLYGTNTDASGALDAIERRLRVRSRSVLIIGAGGAARAIAYEARRRGARVTIANRTEAKGKKLARALGVAAISLTGIPDRHFDILVNATPVGMIPETNCTPLPRQSVRASVVFDAVYNPPLTRFLHDARQNGAVVISGTEMYINQAALQYKLYTGKRADLVIMRRTLQKHP
jgi:3-dehydroquinate dehydratase / shikimate dehydrogenase